MINLYGNGLLGRVDVNWISKTCYDEFGNPYTCYDRKDERFFYFKDHLGSIRMTLDSTSNIVSAQDYYPYGEILRQYTLGSGVNDKYKFTEKERDTETNYDYFGARYYDSELIRWTTVDPLADKYPGVSPFVYCFNNPLRFIDPNGLEGWETTNSWNDEYIKKYRESVTHIMVEYSRAGKEFTCEDLALSILLDFAEANNLPIIIQNGSGTYDVSSDAFSNAADFKNAVLGTTGARDLQRVFNTKSVSISNVQSGDMLLFRDRSPKANHVQVVRGASDNLVGIGQGDTNGLLRYLPAAKWPNSPTYAGKEITFGMYDRVSTIYNNKGTGTQEKGFISKHKIEARTWNFSNFKK